MVVKLFNVAIDAIFKNWAALQLAVKHVSKKKIQITISSILFISFPTDHPKCFSFSQEAGGPQSKEKADWMAGATENWFYENKDLQDFEVEDFLGEIMQNEFNLQIDDGSLEEVARSVCEYYDICSASDEEVVRTKLQR